MRAFDEAGNSSTDSVIVVVLLSFGGSGELEGEGGDGEEEEEGEDGMEVGSGEEYADFEDADGDGMVGDVTSVELEDGTGNNGGGVLEQISNVVGHGISTVLSVVSSTTESIQAVNRSTLGKVSSLSLLTVVILTGSVEMATVAGISVNSLPLIFSHVFLGGLFGATRRRRPFGVVYDSVTKNPLSGVVVRIYRGEELVETVVTGERGEFWVELSSGMYTIVPEKGLYVFPSELVRGVSDGIREPIYRGGVVSLPEGGDTVRMYVPLDPDGVGRRGRMVTQVRSFGSTVFSLLIFGMLILGTVFSVWSFLVVGGILYLVLMVLSVVVLLFNVYVRFCWLGGWGRVETESGELVTGLEVGLYDYTYGRLIDSRVTDDEGRYRFVVSGGRYWIRPVGTEYVLVNATGKGGFEVGEETERDLVLSEKLVVRKSRNTSN